MDHHSEFGKNDCSVVRKLNVFHPIKIGLHSRILRYSTYWIQFTCFQRFQYFFFNSMWNSAINLLNPILYVVHICIFHREYCMVYISLLQIRCYSEIIWRIMLSDNLTLIKFTFLVIGITTYLISNDFVNCVRSCLKRSDHHWCK